MPLLAKLLVTLWVTQFQFAYVYILWTVEKNKDSIPPRKSDILPYVHKALDIAFENHVTAFTEAIPYCFMRGYEYAISENIIPETTVIDAETRTDDYEEYRLNEWKTKHEKCKSCIKNSVCEWPWKEYPELYGWEEFIPILN